jgi:hypothetical protein
MIDEDEIDLGQVEEEKKQRLSIKRRYAHGLEEMRQQAYREWRKQLMSEIHEAITSGSDDPEELKAEAERWQEFAADAAKTATNLLHRALTK